MPLRDHFRPPTSRMASWEEFHGQWPAVIVQQLRKQLPAGFVSAPRVHAGQYAEIDVATFAKDEELSRLDPAEGNGGVATAVWAPPAPSVAVQTALPDEDEFEVRIYDATRERTLVATIEIVSPANKDRPHHRNAFVAKCAALLRSGIAVSIVDLVTIRHANLYAELMEFLGYPDPAMGAESPAIYAVSCRWLPREDRALLQTWSLPMTVGQPLPTLPLWLNETRCVPLELERSYQLACEDLSIP